MMKNTNKPIPEKKRGFKSLKALWMRPEGGLRLYAWLIGAIIICRGVSYGLRLGLNRAFGALFAAWQVNGENILKAPVWARMIYSFHGILITVAACGAMAATAMLLRKKRLGKAPLDPGALRRGIVPGLWGAVLALGSAALFVIMDSMRLEWPLSAPKFSVSLLVMLPVTILTAWAEEYFTKRLVFDGVQRQMGKRWACGFSALIFFLFNGGLEGNGISGLNVLLMGLVTCAWYDRRGLWAAVLFRGLWSYCALFIAGFGATSAAQSVYSLYRVSETAFTGGDGGMIYGWWMTVVMVFGLIGMHRRNVIDRFTTRKDFEKKK